MPPHYFARVPSGFCRAGVSATCAGLVGEVVRDVPKAKAQLLRRGAACNVSALQDTA